MKKRVLCLIMGALAISAAFTGCKITPKSSETSDTSAKATEASTVSKAEETKAAEKEETATEKSVEKTTEKTTEAPTEKPTEAPTEAPKTETVLFENNGIKIIYKGLGKDWLGQTIKLRIENTSGKNYTVQTRDVSVNGFMVEPIFSCDVNRGKTANDEMSFMDSDFEDNEITTINSVELSFHVFNDDDWLDSFDTEKITITP